MNLSAFAFALGERSGVLTTRIPTAPNTASKAILFHYLVVLATGCPLAEPKPPKPISIRSRPTQITRHTNARWVTQIARNLTDGFDGVLNECRFLIRDRDTKFTAAFDAVFSAIGAGVIKTPVRAPQANAIAERFIGTVRRECLDRLLILNEAHALHVLQQFAEHYNTKRPHYALDLDTPVKNNITPLSDGRRLRCNERLGGLIRTYDTVAA